MEAASERIILGIDPGTNIMGYGLVIEKGPKLKLIELGVLKLSQYATHELKLKKIFERVLSLIDTHHPDVLSVEAPFHGKNIQSMLKLGRAQGVAIAAALYREVPVYEYSPTRIKQSITGSGKASKEQVSAMLQRLLSFSEEPKYLDATDGLAAAVCHAFQRNTGNADTNYSGWDAFVKGNPDRTKH